ncbi:hypothetical protein ACROYT_G014745 [Oculina patagonica]
MVRGHSFLENDRDFSLIEKRKKSSTVLLPEDWAPVLEGANMKNPFQLRVMQQSDFKDWKNHLIKKYRMAPKEQSGNPVRFQKILWFNVGWGQDQDENGEAVMTYHPDQIWVKDCHDPSKPLQKIPFEQRSALPALPSALYKAPLPLLAAKMTPFDGDPQRACEGGPLCNPHNQHRTGHT